MVGGLHSPSMTHSMKPWARALGLVGAAVFATGLACEPATASTDPTIPVPTTAESTSTTATTSAPTTTTTTAPAPVPAPHQANEFVDLDCGDPGTFHNIPVTPDDPHGLDSDGDGLGCEDASVFPGGSAGTPEATAPPIAPSGAQGAPQTQGTGQELPRTGSTTAPIAALGGALLTIGAAGFLLRNRVARG